LKAKLRQYSYNSWMAARKFIEVQEISVIQTPLKPEHIPT
jgi:hypothetical protein